MDRLTWTEADQAWAHREGAAWYLWREVLTQPRYRECVPLAPAPLPARPRARHAAPAADDEEPSPVVVVRVRVMRQRRRPTTGQIVALVAVVAVGICAVRSLMGAS